MEGDNHGSIKEAESDVVVVTDTEKVEGKQQGHLDVKPRIGLLGGIAFIMGNVIASGIFISPKAAFERTGSVGLSLVIWTLCGCIATAFGLIYGDFGAILPKSGGDYTFIRAGVGGVPAFLVTWIHTTVTFPGSTALLALVFADNLCAPIFTACPPPDSLRKLIAATEILMLAITNTISVGFATSTQIIFTVAKVAALTIIAVGGFVFLGEGRTESIQSGFDGTTSDVTSIALAIYSCYWAYNGFVAANDIAEEIIMPRRNIPRAAVISMLLVTAIYLVVNVSYFTLLTRDEYLTSSAVAFTWGSKVLGSAAVIMPLSVMCSVYGGANGIFFTNARIRFAAARAGHLPEVMCFLHHKTLIPVMPIILQTAISMLMLLLNDINQLLNMVSFAGFIIVSLTLIGYMRLRLKLGNSPLKVPFAIPVISLCFCVFMIVAPFISSPKIEFLYGLAMIGAGFFLYVPFVHFKLVLPGTNTVTTWLQLLLQLCPTSPEVEYLLK